MGGHPGGGGLTDRPPPFPVAAVSAALGGLWGLLGYAVLWGHVPLLHANRRFVASTLGTVVFFPVRVVLRAIRFAEQDLAGRTFDLSSNNWWIGLTAAALGALLAVGAFLLGRWLAGRLFRARGRGRGRPSTRA